MFPSEEVARSRYTDLPSSPGIFPPSLLDSALTKMRAASNDALFQRTLHPPKIPRNIHLDSPRQGLRLPPLLTVAVFHPWFLGHSSRLRQPPPLPLPSRVGRRGVARVRHPFRQLRWQTKRGWEKVLLTGSRLCCRWGLSVSALEALADSWSRFLGAVRLAGRVSHPLPGFSSSPLSHPDIVSDIPGWISSITGLAPGGCEDVVQGCLGNRP